MQTQSRLSVSGLGSADEHEAVVRELTRGHELTARLQEEAMRALRGKGQAEATAAFILGEMSRAFTLGISIMGGSGPAPPPPGTPRPCVSVAAVTGARRGRAKDDGVPRKIKMTSSPDSDGYQWRKYGQKNIMRTNFPRCYYKCSNHRGRNCPATKQVQQQHNNGDRPLFLVIYVNEHTCHAPPADQPDVAARGAGATTPLVGFSQLSRQGGAHDVVTLDHHGAKEERERQALVSSLTCVLQQGQHSSAGDAGASAATADASELPVRLAGDEDVITDTVYFGALTDKLDDDMLFWERLWIHATQIESRDSIRVSTVYDDDGCKSAPV